MSEEDQQAPSQEEEQLKSEPNNDTINIKVCDSRFIFQVPAGNCSSFEMRLD